MHARNYDQRFMLQTRIVSTKSSLITLNPVRYCNMKWGDVADGSKGDLTAPESDFRFAPESGPKSDMAGGPFRAKARNRFAIDSRKVSLISESGEQDIDRR
jgi:hypothetical protein